MYSAALQSQNTEGLTTDLVIDYNDEIMMKNIMQ